MRIVLPVTPGSSFWAPVADVATAARLTAATKARKPSFQRIFLPSSSGSDRKRSGAVRQRLSLAGRRDSRAIGRFRREPPRETLQQARKPGRQQQDDQNHDE